MSMSIEVSIVSAKNASSSCGVGLVAETVPGGKVLLKKVAIASELSCKPSMSGEQYWTSHCNAAEASLPAAIPIIMFHMRCSAVKMNAGLGPSSSPHCDGVSWKFKTAVR